MKKSNCGASMKPQQKNTPKMAMGGMVGHPANANKERPSMANRRAPQSVQAMTAQSTAGARRQERKYS